METDNKKNIYLPNTHHHYRHFNMSVKLLDKNTENIEKFTLIHLKANADIELKKRILNSEFTILEIRELMRREYDIKKKDHFDVFLSLAENKNYAEFVHWYYKYLLITSHGKSIYIYIVSSIFICKY